MTSAFINKHKEYIIEQYVKEKKSTYEIAVALKTYPNKIRRTLNTLGVPLRDKSAAQTVAINSGKTWPKDGNVSPNKILIVSILKPIEPGMESKEFLIKQNLKIKTKLFKNCEHKISVEASSLGLEFLRKNLL